MPIDKNVANSLGSSKETLSSKYYVQLSTARAYYTEDWKRIGKRGTHLLCHSKKPFLILDWMVENIQLQLSTPELMVALKDWGIRPQLAYGKVTGWIEFYCKRHRHFFYYPEANCGPLNPFKSWKSIRSAASRTFRKIMRNGKIHNVLSITLTYPKEISNYLAKLTDREDEKRVKQCMRAFKEWIDGYFDGYSAMSYNIHKWPTKAPLENHYHAHALLPDWFAADKGKCKDGFRITLPLFDEIPDMKEAWADIVRAQFPNFYVAKKLDVHVEWCYIRKEERLEKLDKKLKKAKSERHKRKIEDKIKKLERVKGARNLLHKLKYNKRRPMVDLAEYFRHNEYKAEDVENPNIEDLIFYDNPTHILGYWSYISLYANRSSKKEMAYCPVCCGPAISTGRISRLPKNVEVIRINRKNEIYRLKRQQYRD